jgi:hypothetical protein
VKLRLHGTPTECEHVARRLAEAFTVVAVSGPYPDRGRSALVRVYVEVRLDPAPGSSASPTGPARRGQPLRRQLQ